MAKPPQWHARFFVTRGQQTEGRRPSAIFVLSTTAPLCIAGMQKRKEKKCSINKNPWYYPLGQHQEESYGFRQRVS